MIASTAHASGPDRILQHLNKKTPVITPVQQESDDQRRQTLCMALSLYHEARGQSFDSQRAVADVILNRIRENGGSICETIWQHAQFSWTRFPAYKIIPRDMASWLAVQWHALTLISDPGPDLTDGATMFYNFKMCHPRWASIGKVTARFGDQIFIRP
jgi:spore germination cell wall hydrolase CwlJ-like protein